MTLMHMTGKPAEYFWNILEISLKCQLQRINFFTHYNAMLILTPNDNTL